jgi:hypothetical protein
MPTLDFIYTIEALNLEIDCTADFRIFIERDGPQAGKNIEIELLRYIHTYIHIYTHTGGGARSLRTDHQT